MAETANRRAVLGCLAGTATLPALVSTAEAGVTDPHVAWAREAARLLAEGNGHAHDDWDGSVALFERAHSYQELIATTEAQTLEGAKVQLAYVYQVSQEHEVSELEHEALLNAMATLDRLITTSGRA